MISKARAIEDPEHKKRMVQNIANFMKIAYVTWNKDNVTDETIIKDLKEMSNGELILEENVNLNRVEFRTPSPSNRQRNIQNKKNRNTSNNRQRNASGGKRY